MVCLHGKMKSGEKLLSFRHFPHSYYILHLLGNCLVNDQFLSVFPQILVASNMKVAVKCELKLNGQSYWEVPKKRINQLRK